MRKTYKIILPLLALAAVAVVTTLYLQHVSIPVTQPRGEIGLKERNLMVFALLLAIIVVVPTFALTIYIAWRYREENHTAKTKYTPDVDRNNLFEAIWWGIPIVIIGVLSVVAWNSAHSLDPYKQLVSSKQPLKIQVVALDWKWLFIYPQQDVAAVNLAEMPVNTPVEFDITSDSVMNSFWIPQLGGQVYAMNGMKTQLHLMASKPGSFEGVSANISGSGFAGMKFTAKAVSSKDFDAWVRSVQKAPAALTASAYEKLAKPSKNNPVGYYSAPQNGLFDNIIMRYMMPDVNLQGATT